MWTCPECKKKIEDDCDMCYYCGYTTSVQVEKKSGAPNGKKDSTPKSQKEYPDTDKKTTDEDVLSSVAVIILVIGVLSSVILFKLSGDVGEDSKWIVIGVGVAVFISSICAWALLKVISNISVSLKKIALDSK